MTIDNILLWMAGVSWLMTAFTAIGRARVGDWSLLKYLGSVLVVAAPLVALFPAAGGWILGALWLVTLVIPMLLFRRIQRLVLQRRFAAALRLLHLLPVLHPIGSYALLTKLVRYQCLRETGRTADAAAQAEAFERFPPALRWQARLMVMAFDQQWPEIITMSAGLPASDGGVLRMRAAGETGDLATLVDDCRSLAPTLEQQPLPYQQMLVIALAFAGRVDLVARLTATTAPAIRTFWIATARWASGTPGEADAARALLAGVRDPGQPCFAAAIDWRLGHPPASVVSMDPGLVARFDQIAAAAERTLVLRAGRPWITWSILAVCVALFALTETADDHIEALWHFGAVDTTFGWAGNWWRFVTASFLHLNTVHLAMNGIALLVFAPALERALTWRRFPVLYLGAGIGGMALVQTLATLDPGHQVFVVGASASIMGLVAAELVRVVRSRVPGKAWWHHPQVQRLGIVVAIQVCFDLSHPSVSQAGHIGGLLTGLMLALLLVPRARH